MFPRLWNVNTSEPVAIEVPVATREFWNPGPFSVLRVCQGVCSLQGSLGGMVLFLPYIHAYVHTQLNMCACIYIFNFRVSIESAAAAQAWECKLSPEDKSRESRLISSCILCNECGKRAEAPSAVKGHTAERRLCWCRELGFTLGSAQSAVCLGRLHALAGPLFRVFNETVEL